LAAAGINMTKLESRPSKEVLGQYIFWADINGHQQDAHVVKALEEIAAKTDLLKICGSYPRYAQTEFSR
jgi:prephenate dehydratase